MKTVSARLGVEVFVLCPNKDCGCLIDLLCEKDTDGINHDEDSYLLSQVFDPRGEFEGFECDEVVCSECKTKFNVKGLEW